MRLARLMGMAKPSPMLPCCAVDGGVDSDHVAVRIQQRPAAVARIDGRIGLDHALQTCGLLGVECCGPAS